MSVILAHRGDPSQAPENTMPAFAAAIASGVDGVEFDVQATADGEMVILHDERLERTTNGKGFVKDLTLAQTKALDAGSWFKDTFAGEKIPTLAETLELFQPTSLFIDIELKTGKFPYPGLAEKTALLVKDMGLAERVVISSFNHQTLLEAKAAAPEMDLGILTYAAWLEPWDYLKHWGFHAIHPEKNACTPELVKGCHQRGFKVRPYTVDGERRARELFDLGVDAICTNRPGEMLALREGA